jgi:hypothetical protein
MRQVFWLALLFFTFPFSLENSGLKLKNSFFKAHSYGDSSRIELTFALDSLLILVVRITAKNQMLAANVAEWFLIKNKNILF